MPTSNYMLKTKVEFIKSLLREDASVVSDINREMAQCLVEYINYLESENEKFIKLGGINV